MILDSRCTRYRWLLAPVIAVAVLALSFLSTHPLLGWCDEEVELYTLETKNGWWQVNGLAAGGESRFQLQLCPEGEGDCGSVNVAGGAIVVSVGGTRWTLDPESGKTLKKVDVDPVRADPVFAVPDGEDPYVISLSQSVRADGEAGTLGLLVQDPKGPVVELFTGVSDGEDGEDGLDALRYFRVDPETGRKLPGLVNSKSQRLERKLRTAERRLAQAQRKLDRLRRLHEDGVATDWQVEDAESALEDSRDLVEDRRAEFEEAKEQRNDQRSDRGLFEWYQQGNAGSSGQSVSRLLADRERLQDRVSSLERRFEEVLARLGQDSQIASEVHRRAADARKSAFDEARRSLQEQLALQEGEFARARVEFERAQEHRDRNQVEVDVIAEAEVNDLQRTLEDQASSRRRLEAQLAEERARSRELRAEVEKLLEEVKRLRKRYPE